MGKSIELTTTRVLQHLIAISSVRALHDSRFNGGSAAMYDLSVILGWPHAYMSPGYIAPQQHWLMQAGDKSHYSSRAGVPQMQTRLSSRTSMPCHLANPSRFLLLLAALLLLLAALLAEHLLVQGHTPTHSLQACSRAPKQLAVLNSAAPDRVTKR